MKIIKIILCNFACLIFINYIYFCISGKRISWISGRGDSSWKEGTEIEDDTNDIRWFFSISQWCRGQSWKERWHWYV